LESICSKLLGCCLRGERWPQDLLRRALEIDEGRAFLSDVVEPLGDLFEPRLCETYRELFSQAVALVCPELTTRVKRGWSAAAAPPHVSRVYVLSRVTLGADVAVTSVLLDSAKRRYPTAEIVFVAPRKNYELFESDPRIRHLPAPYARAGTLGERLRASAALWLEDGLVIDPDSRLTQLGIISVCPAGNYLFFESRSYGGEGMDRLPDLAARWMRETLGVDCARPYIAPLSSSKLPPDLPVDITVSLGVGENPAKRIGGSFENELMRMLAATGASVLVDKGGSEEEGRRVESVLQPGMRTHEGSFAPFAAQISRSKLFIGYDSAAGHVASACGVPQIAIMNGFASERMLSRWRPNGTIVRGDAPHPLQALRLALSNECF
jgi:Glycosyltransferase family 9 (heptosyltransferase)